MFSDVVSVLLITKLPCIILIRFFYNDVLLCVEEETIKIFLKQTNKQRSRDEQKKGKESSS